MSDEYFKEEPIYPATLADNSSGLEPVPVESTGDRPDTQLLTILSEDIFIEQFAKGVQNYKRWQALCVGLTNERDWVNQGTPDNPRLYLQATGAEALANPMGIDYGEPTFRKEERTHPDHGPFYIVYCTGWIESKVLKRRGHFLGSCTSRDKFFSSKKGWDSIIQESDVYKKAMSNWEANGVSRLAGIRNPSPEMIKAAGLDLNKITSIDYTGSRNPQRQEQVISQAQDKRLYAVARSHGVSAERLKELMAYLGYEHTGDCKIKHYDKVVAWLEKGGPDWTKEQTHE